MTIQTTATPPGLTPHRLAVHEAGHAVLACLLRLRFDHVTIGRRRSAAGRIAGLDTWIGMRERFNRHDPRAVPAGAAGTLERRVEKVLLCLNAGIAAEGAYCGPLSSSAAWSQVDCDSAFGLLKRLYAGDEEAADAHLRFIEQRMPEVVSDDGICRAVLKTADVLAQVRTLYPVQVRQLVLAHTDGGRACRGVLRHRRFSGLRRWLRGRDDR